ncbi:MAG: hypothetical protein JW820_18200 [Spirochaetales bacterium]|nr:hypothetical protein [Spirochaetales bacterium]
MRIAIQPDFGPIQNPERDRSSPRWAELLQQAGHEVSWVDVYRADIIEQLRGCHGFMWRHAHHSGMWHIARRLLPVIERELQLTVYPDQATCWHYDDKVAQAYLFRVLKIPTPTTWVWFDASAALAWSAVTRYPLVMKLWSGACSKNVRLVVSPGECETWIRRMFGAGVYSLDPRELGPLHMKKRLRVAARCLLRGQAPGPPAETWDLHKNYVYFQEYIPDNDYDTRVTVIGNRAFGFRRLNRPDDFRASGSGRIEWDPQGIAERAIRLGFDVAHKLKTQSVALDILQSKDGPVITEVSYTYASWAIYESPGHWVLAGSPESGALTWKEGHMWPEEAQIHDLLARLTGEDASLSAESDHHEFG